MQKNYTLNESGDITKDDILAIDEALIDGWELENKNCLKTWDIHTNKRISITLKF